MSDLLVRAGAQELFLLASPRSSDWICWRNLSFLAARLYGSRCASQQSSNFRVRLRAEQFDFFFGPGCVKNGRNIRFLPLAMSRVDHSGDALDQLGIGILS